MNLVVIFFIDGVGGWGSSFFHFSFSGTVIWTQTTRMTAWHSDHYSIATPWDYVFVQKCQCRITPMMWFVKTDTQNFLTKEVNFTIKSREFFSPSDLTPCACKPSIAMCSAPLLLSTLSSVVSFYFVFDLLIRK